MKKLNILKTFAINIVVISLLCAFCFPINAVLQTILKTKRTDPLKR